MKNEKLHTTIDLIAELNALDPNTETNENGDQESKECLYSRRMSEILSKTFPDASEHLTIAAHAQHIERWKSARSDYPEGRTGYKKWRSELGAFHAKRAGDCMEKAGYSEDDLERVKYLIQKRGLKQDEETQALEDTICIVFLKYYLNSFAKKHNEEKIISIIQKTWKKMSEYGHSEALKLEFSKDMLALIKKAL